MEILAIEATKEEKEGTQRMFRIAILGELQRTSGAEDLRENLAIFKCTYIHTS
jgi:hypothetical protein